MKKLFLFTSLIVILIFTFLIFNLDRVLAQVTLRYPISELGYCRDAKECYLYCEIPQNKASCWSYSKYKLGLSSSTRVLGESTSDDEEEARRLGITFPISELGNCPNVSECKAYCDNPSNQEACMDFASRKGIGGEYKKYKPMMDELGCRNQQECRSLCENPQNQERCMSVAEKYMPGEFRAQKEEMMRRARETLGCDSMESCSSFCSEAANQEKCMSFADQHMPAEARARMEEMRQRMGERMQQQGLGCDSMESCRTYCESNPGQCQQFSDPAGGQQINIHREEGFTCSTEEQCKNWCQQNPDKCSGFPQGGFEQGPTDYQNYGSEEQTRSFDQQTTPQVAPSPTP